MPKVSDILRLIEEEKAREKSFRHRRSQADSTMRNGIIHSTFTLLVFFFLLASSTVALSPDGVALISFKALLSDPKEYLANWNESDTDPCRWTGVRCHPETRRVHMLVLASKRLRGSISAAIGKLGQLRRLSLHANQLYGPIPKEIGNCSSLRYLYLQKNYLTGNIPTELGKLSLLKALNLASNGLMGTIPSTIGFLSRLDSLNVSSNFLLGRIPTNGVLKNFTLQSFLENPGLCGSQVNITCQSDPPAPAPLVLSPAIPPASPPSPFEPFRGGRSSPAPSPTMVSEVGGSIAESTTSLKRGYSIVLLISAVCIALLIVLVCFWCWFLRTEYGTQDNGFAKGAEAYHGAKVVKFHGDLTYTSMDILKRTKLLDERDMIGSGRFGTVYRLVMEDGNSFAVKRIGVLGLSSDAVFERELKILGSFKHGNLVNLRGYCISPVAKFLIYDYLPRGNLEESLHDRELQAVVLNWAVRMRIAIGTGRGIAHLHHGCFPPIVHSDIKSSNVLLDENLDPHLSDFGLAKLLEDNTSHVSTIVAGTFGYLAPEYMDTGRATEKGDVYSFGVVLLELISGRRPSDPSLLAEGLSLVGWVTMCIKENIQFEIFDSKIIDVAPREQLESVLKIAVMCINPVPEERPTMHRVVQLLETIPHSPGPSELTNSHRSPHSVEDARGR